MKKSPNFFIVGAAKAGTTTLYNILKMQSEVYLSPIKEVHYFSNDIVTSKFSKEYRDAITLDVEKYIKKWNFEGTFSTHLRDKELYYSLFQKVEARHKIIGEVSPSYLYSKVAAQNIKKELGNPRIIMILRNPVERAYSHYLMDVRIGYTKEPFLKLIDKELSQKENYWGRDTQYIGLGLYYEQVKRYLELFPKEKILILFFDDLKQNYELTIKTLFNFLGIQNNELKTKTYNKAQLPRSKFINYFIRKAGIKNLIGKIFSERIKSKLRSIYYTDKKIPPLSKTERQKLNKIFEKDVQKLSDLLNKDLTHWLKY